MNRENKLERNADKHINLKKKHLRKTHTDEQKKNKKERKKIRNR